MLIDTSHISQAVICHVFMHCLGSFLFQDILLNTTNLIEYLPAFYIARRAQLRLQLFASSVGRSLSRITFCSRTIVLGDAVAFLRESYTFVSERRSYVSCS